ncbi:ATPase [Opitutaceae bacterium TAV5]|nr:ATPase [Opitutaceae bacterium TAV5]
MQWFAAIMETSWTETLARFLRNEPGVEAVRLDPVTRKVAVATLGEVDMVRLRERLDATLAAIDSQLGTVRPGAMRDRRVRTGHGSGAGATGNASPASLPEDYTVEHGSDGITQVARPTCATAPRFWQWREFAWPELRPDAETGVAGAGEEGSEWKQLAWLAAVCGVSGLAAFLLEKSGVAGDGNTAGDATGGGILAWLPRALYIVALATGGWDAAVDTLKNLRRAKLDIHFLMLAVAVGAVCIGAWGEAALLLFLFSASGAMEEFSVDRTHREVSALLRSAPRQATLVEKDGREREIAVGEIGIADVLRVRPGAVFPADGEVVRGETASDESNLTGEAAPVDKAVGDPVFSGTLNLWGAVDFRVRRLPSESTLQKIIRLIHTAQKLRAPSERLTDRFGPHYTLLVLGVCAAMFLVWWLGMGLPAFVNEEGARSAFYRAMTLLVVMSPCALVLSIPSAILAAIAWGARHGVLFRGGAAIEKLAGIGVVALDKTGTLTTGELVVEGCESFPPGREREVWEYALALELGSQHPLARAIVRDARARGVAEHGVAEFQSLTGHGVSGRVGAVRVVAGRRELLEAGPLAGWSRELPPARPEFTEVWIVAGDLLGRLLLRDQVRAESREVLASLKAAGIRTVMLTGDRRHAAESVARQLGLDEVRAGLLPEQKVEAVRELRAEGCPVAMVGDGVNDAPSLAAADVSIAMGARGSDAALEQAEVILMHDRIENVLSALRLSRRARTIIRQNLVISLGVVGVMALAAISGIVPLAAGVAAHEGSTVVVCLNSLRLLFGKNR